jgi:YfiH family protein
VVTADCVPILVASERGDAVAAIHAGWRGLARGVVGTGIDALRHAAPGAPLRAVVGPHIGPCCYEIDAPVIEALGAAFGAALADALAPARAGHARLDLAALARVALLRAGLAPQGVAGLPRSCTRCEPERFHSYRRDGARAGRLVHFIAASCQPTRGQA